jgi:hypothetical protein
VLWARKRARSLSLSKVLKVTDLYVHVYMPHQVIYLPRPVTRTDLWAEEVGGALRAILHQDISRDLLYATPSQA